MIRGRNRRDGRYPHGHARGPGRLRQDPHRGAGDRPQPLAPGHPAGGDLRPRGRGGAGDQGRLRRPDGPGGDPGDGGRAQPERRPPAHRPGVRQRGRAGRPARGRDPGGRAGPLRLHRAGARVRLPAGRVPRPLHGPLADRRRLGDLRRPARAAHPRLAVHGHHRPGPRPGPAGADHRPRAGRPRPGRVRAPARPHRRRARRPGHRRRGPADHPAPGDGRQRRHQAARQGGQALHPGVRRRRAVLGRRRPLRPGRLRRRAERRSRCARP